VLSAQFQVLNNQVLQCRGCQVKKENETKKDWNDGISEKKFGPI
jgi:hypothetical protein